MLRLAYQQGRFGMRVPIMRCQNAIARARYATGQKPAPPDKPPIRASQGRNSKGGDKDRDGTSSRNRRSEDNMAMVCQTDSGNAMPFPVWARF